MNLILVTGTILSVVFNIVFSRVPEAKWIAKVRLICFSNPDNYLLNGNHCDEFNIFGRDCDINLRVCVEDLKDTSDNLEQCKDGNWLETGVIDNKGDRDTVCYDVGEFDNWENPHETPAYGKYEGIRIKIQAFDSCYDDCPNELIDEFYVDVTQLPNVISNYSINHNRPGALDSTHISFEVTISCLNFTYYDANQKNCLPIVTPTPSPHTTQFTTTALWCENGGTPDYSKNQCDCPNLFTGQHCENGPQRNCYDLLVYYGIHSGLAEITLNGNKIQVYCDEGWTLIQRRTDDQILFNRTWEEYKQGFGNIEFGSFWLGNEIIYGLTNTDGMAMTLQVQLYDCKGEEVHETYGDFRIDSEATKYTLRMSSNGVSGDAGDAIMKTFFGASQNNQMFRVPNAPAPDPNGDFSPQTCANLFQGGWWYSFCGYATLNGKYHRGCKYTLPNDELSQEFGNGILWLTWYSDIDYSMEKSIMKIRPKNVS